MLAQQNYLIDGSIDEKYKKTQGENNMFFAPKERGQGLIEAIILIALAVFAILVILNLPECGGDWRDAILKILGKNVCGGE